MTQNGFFRSLTGVARGARRSCVINMSDRPALQPDVWVDRYADVLYRYALARIGRAELAEDLVQETFLAALRSGRSFAGDSSEQTWLIGILRHRLMDEYRNLGHRERSMEGSTGDEAVAGLFSKGGKWVRFPVAWEAPDRAFDQTEFWSVFHNCLGALPPRQAAAFSLRDVDGLDSDKVCEILGTSATNLWTLLHRARLRLSACLERHWFGLRGEA